MVIPGAVPAAAAVVVPALMAAAAAGRVMSKRGCSCGAEGEEELEGQEGEREA